MPISMMTKQDRTEWFVPSQPSAISESLLLPKFPSHLIPEYFWDAESKQYEVSFEVTRFALFQEFKPTLEGVYGALKQREILFFISVYQKQLSGEARENFVKKLGFSAEQCEALLHKLNKTQPPAPKAVKPRNAVVFKEHACSSEASVAEGADKAATAAEGSVVGARA